MCAWSFDPVAYQRASISCSTLWYRFLGFTWVHRVTIRPIRPSASFLEGCFPVSMTLISTPTAKMSVRWSVWDRPYCSGAAKPVVPRIWVSAVSSGL